MNNILDYDYAIRILLALKEGKKVQYSYTSYFERNPEWKYFDSSSFPNFNEYKFRIEKE